VSPVRGSTVGQAGAVVAGQDGDGALSANINRIGRWARRRETPPASPRLSGGGRRWAPRAPRAPCACSFSLHTAVINAQRNRVLNAADNNVVVKSAGGLAGRHEVQGVLLAVVVVDGVARVGAALAPRHDVVLLWAVVWRGREWGRGKADECRKPKKEGKNSRFFCATGSSGSKRF
jgi:hypothetical protein